MDSNFYILLASIFVVCMSMTYLLIKLREGGFTVVRREKIIKSGVSMTKITYKNGKIKYK